MCFDNDADWRAEHWDETDGPAGTEAKCFECRAVITAGEWRKNIYLRQYEECQTCEDEWSDSYQKGVVCDHHDYGEEFECDRCLSCDKLLRVIKVLEEEEGCPPHAQQPMLGELADAILEDRRYLPYAVAMFPELARTPWGERSNFKLAYLYTLGDTNMETIDLTAIESAACCHDCRAVPHVPYKTGRARAMRQHHGLSQSQAAYADALSDMPIDEIASTRPKRIADLNASRARSTALWAAESAEEDRLLGSDYTSFCDNND